jgi:DNA-binding protein HU-beta
LIKLAVSLLFAFDKPRESVLTQPWLCQESTQEQYLNEGETWNMNKQELVGAVADAAGLAKTDAAKAVDAVFDAITGELKKGGDVRLVGFGTFSVTKRKASTGRNPRTGETMTIKASSQPKFKAGKGLKDAVN